MSDPYLADLEFANKANIEAARKFKAERDALEVELDQWVRQAEDNSGEAQRYALALEEIAAMDPKGIRADDLGRAARIARDAIAGDVGTLPEKGV